MNKKPICVSTVNLVAENFNKRINIIITRFVESDLLIKTPKHDMR